MGETTEKGATPNWTWSRCDREVRYVWNIPGAGLLRGKCRGTIQHEPRGVNSFFKTTAYLYQAPNSAGLSTHQSEYLIV